MNEKINKDFEYGAQKMNPYNFNYAKNHEIDKPQDSLYFKEILKLYQPRSEEKILEIGCNTGEFCWLLKIKYNIYPVGIDINSAAISMAKEKYPNIEFQMKNLFEVEGKYDVIYMHHVIEHIEYPKKALKKLRSMLTENGKIILVCPNGWAYLLKLSAWVQRTKFCYDPTHFYEFNSISLSKILEDSGYQTIKCITKPAGIPYIHHFISDELYYSIPSSLFGAYIFVLAKKK